MAIHTHNIAIIGGGSWATALAHILSYNATSISLLVRDPHLAHTINTDHCNTKYFPEFPLSPSITATTSAQQALNNASVVIYASSMQHARTLLQPLSSYIQPNTVLLTTSKGIEEDNLKTMYDIIADLLPHHLTTMCVLSGPSFAKEVLQNKYTSVVIASHDETTALMMQQLFSTPTFRVYRSSDILGVELCGAIKNVIAIATGIVEVLQESSNAQASIITRGLAEMTRLGTYLGAKQETFLGLAGIGDLLLTCTGSLSRNKHVGKELAKGKKLPEILEHMDTIAEGVYTCNAVHSLAEKHGIYMPITKAVYNLLHQKQSIHEIYNLFTTPSTKKEYS